MSLRRRLVHASRRKFVRDTVTLQVASFVQLATYFITSIWTANYLGDHDYGRWAAARELFAIAYFVVSMGVVNATITVYSDAVGRQDRQDAVNALAALLKIGTITSLALIVAGFALGPLVADHFYGGDREVGQIAAVLCLSGVAEILRGLATAALQGTRQMKRWTVFDIAANVVRLGLIGAVVLLDLHLEGMVAAFLAHMTLTAVFAFVAYHKARLLDSKIAPPPLREVFAALGTAPLRRLFGLSYLIALNKQMNTIVPRLGLILVPALATADFADNGSYAVASVLAGALSMALSGVAQTLLPTLGYKMGADGVPFEQMGGILKRVSLATGAFMCLATLASVPVVWWLIDTFYLEEYGDAFPYFLWLVSGNLIIGFCVAVDAFYLYSGKIRQVVPFNFLLAGIATAGILLGSHLFGPMGTAAAAGLCRGLAVLHLVYMWFWFRKARARLAAGPARQGPGES